MSPPMVMVWTVLLSLVVAGLALGLVALGLACRRWRASVKATERRLDALAGGLARLEARGASARSVAGTGSAMEPTQARRPAPTHRADRPASTPSAFAGPSLIAVPDLARKPSAEISGVAISAELGRRFGEVCALDDAGVPVPAIARATGLPIGQVELILGLRRRGQGAGLGREPHRS